MENLSSTLPTRTTSHSALFGCWGPRGFSKVRRKKNEHGEYVVRFWNLFGEENKEARYFTDSWEDAKATAEKMANG